MKSLMVALLLSVATVVQAASTPVNEINTAALVGPFDQSEGHQTYITVHSPSALSPSTGLPQVVTHWTFWSDSCDHLADFYICLTKDDSVVVDTSNASSQTIDNEREGPVVDLTGFRGIFTVHAFETDERCKDPADLGFLFAPNSINGTWTIANTETNASFGDRTQGLLVEENEVTVPDQRFGAVDIPFFNPQTVAASAVILLTVVERFGDLPGEVGPPAGLLTVGARAAVFDNLENRTSLPDIEIGCAFFATVKPSDESLIPDIVSPQSSGFVRLSSPRIIPNEGDDEPITGGNVWVYAFHGQQLGSFGTGSRGTYVFTSQFGE